MAGSVAVPATSADLRSAGPRQAFIAAPWRACYVDLLVKEQAKG